MEHFNMKIVEQKVSAGNCDIFELAEFLSRPLYAHLAHNSDEGPPEAIWIIGGASFPVNLKRDPRCALGIVDWDPTTGLSHHVGMRGRAEVLPFDPAKARSVFQRYLGPDEADWDPRFDYSVTGEAAGLTMVRFTPETVVVRDQSYKPTQWARGAELRRQRPT
jgi:hypothetical protein